MKVEGVKAGFAREREAGGGGGTGTGLVQEKSNTVHSERAYM